MNFCTECKSLYEKPGTCNCYATVAKPVQPQLVTPYIPWVPYTPPSPNQWPGANPYPLYPVITYGTVTIQGNTTGIAFNEATSVTRTDSTWNQNWTYTA